MANNQKMFIGSAILLVVTLMIDTELSKTTEGLDPLVRIILYGGSLLGLVISVVSFFKK